MPEQNDTSAATPAAAAATDQVGNEQAIYDAFMLGWLIVELKSRIQIARFDPNDFTLQLASMWRSIVNRISVLQMKAFPDSSTANTLYNPPGKEGLPYLYPPAPDYGNIGISQKNNAGTDILENFKLFEVTRRGINCLTLLYLKEKESLIPDLTVKYQKHLIEAIVAASQNSGSGGGAVQSEENTVQLQEGGEDANSPEGTPDPQNDLEEATSILTERTVKFLEAWDGFLRENYYAGGLIPNDDSELMAYEAGHSMSLLSWGVSLATVPLENMVDKLPDIKERLIKEWKNIFRVQAVMRLQHQISALSSALDDAWYKRNPTVTRQDDDGAVLQAPNPDLPNQAIHAVKVSLDFWQRTIDYVDDPKNSDKFRDDDAETFAGWSKAMRLALIQQANIWQTLMTGQQSLRAFNMESITHKLMQDVTEGIQNSLRTNFKGSLHQAEDAMKEMAVEVKEAITVAGAAAIHGIEEMYQTYKRFLLPIAAIIGVIVLVLVFAVVYTHGSALSLSASGGAGFTGLITMVLGYFGLNNVKGVKNSQQAVVVSGQDAAHAKIESKAAAVDAGTDTKAGNGDLFSRIEGAGQEAGKVVLEAMKKGYEQIKIELAGLSRSAAVAYPLIEFFTTTFTLEGDEEFLTSIIWSGKERAEEIQRVMAAAFGSLAIFITPSGDDSSKKTTTTAEAAP